jgi:hypothetical protein
VRSETLQAHQMAMRALGRAARGSLTLRRLKSGDPWWHSVCCCCDDCLDMDALVCELRAQAGSRPLFGEDVTE